MVPSNSKKEQAGTLILITNHFPYGIYESFLEPELPYLQAGFEKVFILSRDSTAVGQRPVQDAEVVRINPTSDLKEKLITGWLYCRHAIRIFKYVKDELEWLKKRNRKLTIPILDEIVHTLTKALATSHHLNKVIGSNRLKGKVTLYSYWLTASALATTFVTRKNVDIKRISRAHGGDVYEYRTAIRYLSFRRTLANELDNIFAISTDGCNHLKQESEPKDPSRIQMSRLGTPTTGKTPPKADKAFTVVSCSYIISVKRLHLLIQALEKIDLLKIHWIHIGDGTLEETIKKLAHEKLRAKSNVTYNFVGVLSNQELLAFYQKQYVDAFINTSSSEGIPVTMMEAQSFGIPLIGPKVGGIPEIIAEGTGRLFEVDASPLAIAETIQEVLLVSASEYQDMRQKAFQNWNAYYNAANNFSTFVAQISKL